MSEWTDTRVEIENRLCDEWYCVELKLYEMNSPCQINARHRNVTTTMTPKLKSVKARHQMIDAAFLNTLNLELIL